VGGEEVGLGNGGFVAAGVAGGSSKSTDRVGEGNGSFFVFEFSFALSLALRFTLPTSGVTLT
jgi:hypothetical protein